MQGHVPLRTVCVPNAGPRSMAKTNEKLRINLRNRQ